MKRFIHESKYSYLMKKVCLLLFILAFSSHAKADGTAHELFQAINQRLSYMKEVALYKAANSLPIEDIQREEVVIEQSKRVAYEEGLNPEKMEYFFRAQISAAKAIQYRYRADLLSQPTTQKPEDLNEIRPELIRLGNQIIVKISDYIKEHGSFDQISYSEFEPLIDVHYIENSDKKLLFDTLKNIVPL